MQKRYLGKSGLDTETGRQKAKNLERLGLSDVLQDLKQRI